MQKIISYIATLLILVGHLIGINSFIPTYQPRLVFSQVGDIQIKNPEVSQAFYDDLKGKPRDFFVDSSQGFQLYVNLMVPEPANASGRYSARIFSEQQIAELDGGSFVWQEFYDSYTRDYYSKGPEFSQQVPAGKYKIEVYSSDNKGKYVLVIGEKETYSAISLLNVFWQIPFLKITFLKTSIVQFFLTPIGIAGIGIMGAVLIFLALIYFVIGLIKKTIKHNQAKTLLLASSGSQMREDITKLLQKPAYDVMVAFINTAQKPELEKNPDYKSQSLQMMQDMGFNVQIIDIEGKSEHEVLKLLELNDIIFVAGGNTFYLLKAMRECNFEKVIRKLLKDGKVYIGSSAGSIVAGRTIQTSNRFGTGGSREDENFVRLKNLKGLNLVPFDIFVHYQPEDAEIIKVKIKNPKKRAKQLKILTDGQAILVQGREVDLIGEGEAVVI